MIGKDKSNKNSNSRLIIGIILLVVLVIGIVGVTSVKFLHTDNKEKDTVEEDDFGIKYNTNEDMVKDKDVGGVLFTNIECSYDGNMSLITYTIVNNTDKDINLMEYEVVVRDDGGNILTTIAPTLDRNIAPKESFDTGNAVDIDLSNAKSMELVLN